MTTINDTRKWTPAIWKDADKKWNTFDPREGDTFISDTKLEAIKIWNNLFLICSKKEIEQLYMNVL